MLTSHTERTHRGKEFVFLRALVVRARARATRNEVPEGNSIRFDRAETAAKRGVRDGTSD